MKGPASPSHGMKDSLLCVRLPGRGKWAGAVLSGLWRLLAVMTLMGTVCGKAWRREETLASSENVQHFSRAGEKDGGRTSPGGCDQIGMKRLNFILEATGGMGRCSFWGVLFVLIFHSLFNCFLIFDIFYFLSMGSS